MSGPFFAGLSFDDCRHGTPQYLLEQIPDKYEDKMISPFASHLILLNMIERVRDLELRAAGWVPGL